MKEKKRVAVVTGGNRGIGLEICKQLSGKGFKVILTSRNEEKGQTVATYLQSQGLDIDFCKCDVRDEDSIQELKIYVLKTFGRCDVLVNNAAIFPDMRTGNGSFSSVLTASLYPINKAMETNTFAPMLLCQTFIPIMKEQKYGRIVNVSSGMGQLSDMNGGSPAYRLSKVGLNALTRMFADELKGENILVNCMCPGWVKTDMGGVNATREVEEGADTAIWLATLPDEGSRGMFFRDRKIFAW